MTDDAIPAGDPMAPYCDRCGGEHVGECPLRPAVLTSQEKAARPYAEMTARAISRLGYWEGRREVIVDDLCCNDHDEAVGDLPDADLLILYYRDDATFDVATPEHWVSVVMDWVVEYEDEDPENRPTREELVTTPA